MNLLEGREKEGEGKEEKGKEGGTGTGHLEEVEGWPCCQPRHTIHLPWLRVSGGKARRNWSFPISFFAPHQWALQRVRAWSSRGPPAHP